jgi:hypothetical protein
MIRLVASSVFAGGLLAGWYAVQARIEARLFPPTPPWPPRPLERPRVGAVIDVPDSAVRTISHP